MDTEKRHAFFGGSKVTLAGREVETGTKAPDFIALKTDLSEFHLKDLFGKTILISTYPIMDTGICPDQAKKFNKEAEALGDRVNIIAISADPPFALGRFCGTEGITSAITLSDHKYFDFGTKYGFLIKELRLLNRGAVIIDKNGIIKYTEYCREAKESLNFEAAMKALTSLLDS